MNWMSWNWVIWWCWRMILSTLCFCQTQMTSLMKHCLNIMTAWCFRKMISFVTLRRRKRNDIVRYPQGSGISLSRRWNHHNGLWRLAGDDMAGAVRVGVAEISGSYINSKYTLWAILYLTQPIYLQNNKNAAERLFGALVASEEVQLCILNSIPNDW